MVKSAKRSGATDWLRRVAEGGETCADAAFVAQIALEALNAQNSGATKNCDPQHFHWFSPEKYSADVCSICGVDRDGRNHYCSGKTQEEWQPIAEASFASAAHLPED